MNKILSSHDSPPLPLTGFYLLYSSTSFPFSFLFISPYLKHPLYLSLSPVFCIDDNSRSQDNCSSLSLNCFDGIIILFSHPLSLFTLYEFPTSFLFDYLTPNTFNFRRIKLRTLP